MSLVLWLHNIHYALNNMLWYFQRRFAQLARFFVQHVDFVEHTILVLWIQGRDEGQRSFRKLGENLFDIRFGSGRRNGVIRRYKFMILVFNKVY